MPIFTDYFFLLLFIVLSSKKITLVCFKQELQKLEIEMYLFFQSMVSMENKTDFLCKFKIYLFACLFSPSRDLCILIYHRRVT